MKAVFMGTPDFAVPTLNALIENHEVLAVVSQPDKPKGRGKKMQPTPVKLAAEAHGIPVYQPAKIKDPEFVEFLSTIKADVFVVVAYGQILPQSILDMPKYGCINIHASLLPRYRGAAPIEWSVINGEKETGVTTMFMAEGLDTGDIIEEAVTEIGAKETAEDLRSRLAELGAELILSTMKAVISGDFKRTPQDDSKSNYAVRLSKEMGKADWSLPAVKIERLIRGLRPWPVVYSSLSGRGLKIYAADVVEDMSGEPGEIIEVGKKNFVVACGKGALRIRMVQPEGKKMMDAASFLNGNKLTVGMRFE